MRRRYGVMGVATHFRSHYEVGHERSQEAAKLALAGQYADAIVLYKKAVYQFQQSGVETSAKHAEFAKSEIERLERLLAPESGSER